MRGAFIYREPDGNKVHILTHSIVHDALGWIYRIATEFFRFHRASAESEIATIWVERLHEHNSDHGVNIVPLVHTDALNLIRDAPVELCGMPVMYTFEIKPAYTDGAPGWTAAISGEHKITDRRIAPEGSVFGNGPTPLSAFADLVKQYMHLVDFCTHGEHDLVCPDAYRRYAEGRQRHRDRL